jgi:hypothetical protein
MKIRPVGAQLFRAERWTDMTKLIIDFREFANVPKNWKNSIKLSLNISPIWTANILNHFKLSLNKSVSLGDSPNFPLI